MIPLSSSRANFLSLHLNVRIVCLVAAGLVVLIPTDPVSAHHEPTCPPDTSPLAEHDSKYCTCVSTHEAGMEVTCSNKKSDDLGTALSVYKKGPGVDLPITTLVLQLNFVPTIDDNTFADLQSVKDLQFKLNRIKNFSANAFHGLEDSLEKLTILEFFWVSFKYKTLDQVPVEALRPLRNLKELFLSSANIRNIPPNAFQSLKNLEVLKIMSFTLNKIYNDSLGGLLNLKDFSLVSNFMKDLPVALFSPTPNLESLFFSLKSFKTIPKDLFSKLRYVRDLSFNNSGIDTIEDGSFAMMSNSLKSLSLKGNQMTIMPKSVENLPKLTTLDLSSNTLFEIHQNAMAGLSSLEHLSLAYNIIKNIKGQVLEHSTYLKFLDLKANLLTKIPENFFTTFRNLEVLDLSKNFIGELPELTFYQNDKLQKLDLSNNNLKTVYPTSFKSLGKSLSYLDLSHNYLPELPAKTLSEFQNLVHLNISHNNMTRLDIDSLEGSEDTLRFIGLSDNPWHCDCKMRKFREWYKFWSTQLSHSDKYLQEKNLDNAKCHTPVNLAGVPILYPPLNALTFCAYEEYGNTSQGLSYHIKGTDDIFINDDEILTDDNDYNRVDRFAKDPVSRSIIGTGPGSGKHMRELTRKTNAALVISIMMSAFLCSFLLAKFLFSGANKGKGDKSDTSPGLGNTDMINNNNPHSMSNGGSKPPSRFGNFLTSFPTPLYNGHGGNVPEDKQVIANHGYPMGTVS